MMQLPNFQIHAMIPRLTECRREIVQALLEFEYADWCFEEVKFVQGFHEFVYVDGGFEYADEFVVCRFE